LAKNEIQWLKDDVKEDNSSDSIIEESESELEKLNNDLTNLKQEERTLDVWINAMKADFEKLAEDNSFKEYGYVTFEDIKQLTNGEDINLIAIKAPPGTSLEIPDPEQIHSIYKQTLEVK
jgi:transcription factor E2F3